MSKGHRIKKIAVIFGTRPEAIKMAPVIKELQKSPLYFKTIICVTAQHRDMLDEVLNLFNIKAHYDLNIMMDNQSLFEVTEKGLMGIRQVLEKEMPDCILVQGDTTSTFTAALAAFYLKVPIGHIEAGLRTKDKYRPFPEEINRRLTSHLSDFHFAPTRRAREQLIAEGIDTKRVFLTGNTIIDALLHISQKNSKKEAFDRQFPFITPKTKKLILVTAHRRENFGRPLENICLALKEIVERNKNAAIVYPLHPNPNVDVPVRKILGKINGINLVKPLNYAAFVRLMKLSHFIITDSGGIQEEASSLHKPVLIMRDETERQEVVESGIAKLVGADRDKIVSNAEALLNNRELYKKMAKAVNPFGDGKAAQRIVEIIKSSL